MFQKGFRGSGTGTSGTHLTVSGTVDTIRETVGFRWSDVTTDTCDVSQACASSGARRTKRVLEPKL